MDLYTIRPRSDAIAGYILESDALSHGYLQYQDEADAISFAKWNSRVKGGKIEIFSDAGELVRTEVFPAGVFSY